MPADFTCCECSREIVDIILDVPPTLPLCAACLMIPGWFRVPEIRGMIDPGHDGREALIEDAA